LADPGEAAGVAFGGGEEFVPVEDGADVGVAGVGAAFAGGVGDHDFGFLADVVVGFGKGDGVVVGLGHLSTVEAGDAGSGGEEVAGLGEKFIHRYKFAQLIGVSEILEPNLADIVFQITLQLGFLFRRIRLTLCRNPFFCESISDYFHRVFLRLGERVFMK